MNALAAVYITGALVYEWPTMSRFQHLYAVVAISVLLVGYALLKIGGRRDG